MWVCWGRGRRRAFWRAAAHGGEVAGLHRNGDSGLEFERKLVGEQGSDTLNRSRGLTLGHSTAEARYGGEAANSTAASDYASTEGG